MDVQATLAAVRALALVTSPASAGGRAQAPRPVRATPRRGPRPAAPPPPLRLTRRGRVVVVLFAAVVLTLAVSVARVASSASSPPPVAPAHVVRPGETLWAIAYRAAPRGDTRVMVARIVALNRLRSAEVVPGQAIRLP
jgi:LysM domain